jgi:hypothetical protein
MLWPDLALNRNQKCHVLRRRLKLVTTCTASTRCGQIIAYLVLLQGITIKLGSKKAHSDKLCNWVLRPVKDAIADLPSDQLEIPRRVPLLDFSM